VPEHVHVHEPLTPVLAAYALAVAPCPVVVTCHAAGERLAWYPLAKKMWGILTKRIDYRIAVSDAARRAAEPYVGAPFEVIPNGVEVPADALVGAPAGPGVAQLERGMSAQVGGELDAVEQP
jgi:phosphatidylinositol alpha-mannosyltransferase